MEGGSSTSHSQFLIEAPPQEEYPSEQAAQAAIHSWTKAHKFNVSRQMVERNDDGEIRYRLFVRDQSRKTKNTRQIAEAYRKRPMRRTKRSGCPMRISIVAVDPHNPAGAWRVAHTRDGSYVHNHPGSDDIRVPVAHRQREARRRRATEATNTDIVDLQVMAGVSTSRIYATMLLSDKNILTIPKDIANAKAARRSNLLAHKTSDEALLNMLRDKGFHFSFDIDPESNRLLYLMWAHPAITKLAREFMNLLIVDCTYKTNRYGMPLLNAIILTELNTILPFAQVGLPMVAK